LASATLLAACGSKSTSSKDEITGTPLLKY
jgi:hypothetical protein